MAHGGARQGAGRKPGKSKLTEIEEKAKALGLTPVDFMLAVVNDETEDKRFRGQMAVGAAPYCHRRLAQIEHTGDAGGITVNIINVGNCPPESLVAARLSIKALALPRSGWQASDRDSAPEVGEG